VPALGAIGSWQFPPTDLSPYGQSASEPQVVVNPAGDATAIWADAGGGSTFLVRERRWSVGGWSTTTAVSEPPHSASNLALGANASGVAAAAWVRSNGTNQMVQVATRVGGVWSTPTTLSEPFRDNDAPRVVVDATGVTTVTWLREISSGQSIVQWSRNDGGAWSTPLDLTAAGVDAQRLNLIVDASGIVTAMWKRGTEMQARSFSGSWGSTEVLDTGVAGSPHLAVDPSGVLTAGWTSFDGIRNVARAARRTGSNWSPTVTISPAGETSGMQGMASDASGASTAVVRTEVGANPITQATRLVGGAWSSPVTLSLAGQASYNSKVAAGPTGTAIAIWQQDDGANLRIWAAEFASGAWEAPITLSPSGVDARALALAMGPTGAATATWELDVPALNAQAIRYVPTPAPASAAGGASPLGPNSSATKSRKKLPGSFVLNRKTRVGTTTGTVPAGITRITQSAKASKTKKSKAKSATGRCRITTVRNKKTKKVTKRTFRCTITLPKATWTVTTLGYTGAEVVAEGVRTVSVKK